MRGKRAAQLAMIAASCGIGGAMAQLGCSAIFGLDKTTEREELLEGGPRGDASDAGVDGTTGSFLVQSSVGCVGGDGSYRTIPGDGLPSSEFDILVRTEDGGFEGPFRGIPGSTPTSIELRFEGLPPGERYIREYRENFRNHYVTRGDRLMMMRDQICRPDAELAPEGTMLRITGTGVLDADTQDSLLGNANIGAVGPSGMPPSWNIRYLPGWSLVDKARGDALWMVRRQCDAGCGLLQVCDFPDGYRMSPGESSVSVSCGPPRPQTPLVVNVSSQQFRNAVPSGAEIALEPALEINLIPGHGSYDPAGPNVQSFPVQTLGSEPLKIDLWKPEAWSAVVEVSQTAARHVWIRDGIQKQGPVFVESSFLVSGTSVDVRPLVAAPRQVTVGGKDVLRSGFVKDVGLHPRIVVTPEMLPGRPPPNKYVFVIQESEIEPGELTNWWRFYTRTPELTLPDDILTRGIPYELEVWAYYVSNPAVEETERNGYPQGMATIISNAFTP